MGFAPGCGDGAVGEGAALVAGGEAVRWAGVKRRVLRPRSRISPWVPRRAGMMSASQATLRRVAAATGPVKANVPVPVPVRVPVPVPVGVAVLVSVFVPGPVSAF